MDTFDISAWPEDMRPTWFRMVIARAAWAQGCKTNDQAKHWEDCVANMIHSDPYSLGLCKEWARIDMFQPDDDGTVIVLYAQWIYLRTIGRLDAASNLLCLGRQNVRFQGLMDCFKQCPMDEVSEESMDLSSEKAEAVVQKALLNPYQQMSGWRQSLIIFFYAQRDLASEKEALGTMKEMKHLAKNQRLPSDFFRLVFQSQKLPQLIFDIAAPDTELEGSSKFMASSFRKYKWKESLLWILFQLTPELSIEPVNDAVGDPHHTPEQGVPDVTAFLSFVDLSGAIPFASNPHSIFVFSSLQNFVAGVYDTINANWLLAGHSALTPAQLPHLYRLICQVPPATIKELPISELLQTILLESHELRNLRKTALVAAHRTKNSSKFPGPESSCLMCQHKPSMEQCIRILPVEFTDNVAMSGSAVVPHKVDDPDSVQPKPLGKSQKKKTKKKASSVSEPQRVSLDSMNLKGIKERPDVQSCCGRDITLLVDQEKEEVGGMMFRVFADQELQLLSKDQRRAFPKATPLRRGEKFQHWNNGTMRPVGSRMPIGGRAGDTYTVYPGMEIEEDVDQVRRLFKHAKDIEIVLAKVAPYSRVVANDLLNDSKDCNALGLLGVTAYYCWNYTAPLHRDCDRGWSVSVQIQKTSRQDEYNFAYADWGHYLETRTNCLWWFKGTHTHGTIMPRLSSLQNPHSLSHGFAFTVPQRSYLKAMEHKFLRRSYNQLKSLWLNVKPLDTICRHDQ